MNFKTISMPKGILEKFLSQKSYSYLTFLTFKYALGTRTFFNETFQILERYRAHMQAVTSEKNLVMSGKIHFSMTI